MTHTFTEPQAKHALEVVLNLMKNRRFSLRPRNGYNKWEGASAYSFDPDVFGEALKLDTQINDAYAEAKRDALKTIQEAEKKLGLVPPDLSGNKQIVQCSFFTGGFTICRVYPITAFTQYAPNSYEELFEQCFQNLMGDKTEDDTSPKTIREYRENSSALAEIIWTQLEAVEARDPENKRCVVLMQTRFLCERSHDNQDFMYNKVCGMQEFPYAMGYLFHTYSMHNRIVRHDFVVFNTSHKSHVRIQHWEGEKPTILYATHDWHYSSTILFATVL